MIYIVDRDDEVDWYADPSWLRVDNIDVEGRKREIMKWLWEECAGEVVIYSGGAYPTKGTLNWGPLILGNQKYKTFIFEIIDDALMFKLAWAGS